MHNELTHQASLAHIADLHREGAKYRLVDQVPAAHGPRFRRDRLPRLNLVTRLRARVA